MSPFRMNPRIFSLLVCSAVERDEMTGGWRLQPFSHLAVHRLPIAMSLVVCANIMAPPGEYQLSFRMYHAQESEAAPLAAPVSISIQAGKNVEYMARVAVTLHNTGLYIIEADLIDHDTAYTPLRISDFADVINTMRGGQP